MRFSDLSGGQVRVVLLAASLAVMGSGGTGALAADYLGSARIIAELRGEAAKASDADGTELMEEFSDRAKERLKELPDMEPAEAAAAWLEILTTYWDLQEKNVYSYYNPHAQRELISLDKIFSNLPGPETWPHLQRLVGEQKDLKPQKQAALQLLTARLNNDTAAIEAGIASIENSFLKEGRSPRDARKAMEDMREVLLPESQPQLSALEQFQQDLVKFRTEKHEGHNERELNVPDLLAFTDEGTARQQLLLAVKLPDTKLMIYSRRTLELAREVALENIDSLKEPQWELMEGPGALELYEATKRRPVDDVTTSSEAETAGTPEESLLNLSRKLLGQDSEVLEMLQEFDSEESGAATARAYYFLDLLREGRTADAEQAFDFEPPFLSALNSSLPKALGSLDPDGVYQVVMGKMEEQTTAPAKAWELAHGLARHSNRLAEFVTKLDEAARAPADDEKLELYELLSNSYLALDKPEQAVAALEKIAQSEDAKKQQSRRHAAAQKIVRLGRILDKPEWVTLGVNLMQNMEEGVLDEGIQSAYFIMNSGPNPVSNGMLLEGRGAEAEQYLLERMKQSLKLDKGPGYALQDTLLKSLVLVYHDAGRTSDVMGLLKNAPWWRATDVTGLMIHFSSFALKDDEPWKLAVAVASALEAHGNKAEAVEFLKRCIIIDSGADELYEALTRMTGSEIIPWLDELAARDRFEERPTIWKAVLLHRDGKLEEAEKAARLAMEIDPTDGEARRGRRLFSYQVLSDILRDKKETAEADKLSKVVAAVRLAERGDELNDLGLADRAVEAYGQASRDFSDAYCVEWRLAKRLDERGEDELATQHYRKAFELMPNQFGRMSNLCFGCEDIFELQKPRSVAEEVLQRLAKDPVVKPTVYHLLGQLREAQERYREAAEYYRKATQVDEKYFDAWESLYDISEKAFLSQDEKTSVASRLLEMDPTMQHFSPGSDVTVSPELLWQVGASERKWLEGINEPLFPLSAAKAYLDKKTSEARKSPNMDMRYLMMSYTAERWTGPAKHLVQSGWFSAFQQLLY